MSFFFSLRKNKPRKSSGLFRVALFSLLASALLSACSDLKTREEINKENDSVNRATPKPPPALIPSANTTPAPVVIPELTPNPTPTPISNPVDVLPGPSNRKVGLILGPGGSKALAHIGVLQELLRAKVPVQSVIGIEVGALVGAVFAQKAQIFDSEWQFGKIKDVRDLDSFAKSTFGTSSFDDLRINFACSSIQLKTGQVNLLNRGSLMGALPGCYSSPPLSHPSNHRVADLTGLKKSIDYLRSKGINYIVYVDVLAAKDGVLTGDLDDSENVYWNEIARMLKQESQHADLVIQVPTQDYEMRDWGHRRDLVKTGVEAGAKSATDILRKLGL